MPWQGCIALMLVASSYLTLGIFDPEKARDLWWIYTIITFVLAAANVYMEWRNARCQR